MNRRRLRSGASAALLCLACSGVFAADDERIVPANEEPRHVVKLENEWVRIIDVEIPEGEQTLYHTHSLDYPYVLVTSVTLYNQIHGQEPRDVKMQAGFIGYYNASSKGAYTHRFINRGPGTFRAIGIELLKPMEDPAAPNAALPTLTGAETALDNARVGAYRVKLAPGATIGPLTIPGPSIRVAMGEGKMVHETEGTQTEMHLAPAQFVFQPQTTAVTFTNTGAAELELVEFVLK
ncbi:MAG: hypothetical protein HY067_03555 [Betaproteobacteria bacterium]|nr:hypothetical protein [Betaproteobacteria bacterium]